MSAETARRRIRECLLAWAVLCFVLAARDVGASRRSVRAIEQVRTEWSDTLTIVPFLDLSRGEAEGDSTDDPLSQVIRELLGAPDAAFRIGVQRETETVERLHAAGWRNVARVRWEDSTLCRAAGTRFLMLGVISPYGESSARSFLGTLLTLGMVPPAADSRQLQLDIAIYDDRSGKRVWTYHEEGLRKTLASPQSLRPFVEDRIVRQMPFDRP